MPTPDVAVVVATKDRPDRLAALLDTLRPQTVGLDRFEVIVVDDGSGPATRDLLDAQLNRGDLRLRVIRHESSTGPAIARDAGWRAAEAPVIAFTDDDCVVDPAWLAHGLDALARHPGSVVQGSVGPIPDEAHRLSPFSRTIVIDGPGPPWETCNIFYPTELLQRIDGFDLERFPLPGGEDTDLAWRAIRDGRSVEFAPQARAWHAVIEAGPAGMLRYAWHWDRTVPVFAIHPDLRRFQLHRGIFWSPVHEHLLRALLGLALARRVPLVALWLAAPYLRRLLLRRSGPLLAPYLIALDVTELLAMVRGSLRDRVLVL